MTIYKKATQLKVRFPYKGNLTVEDLWDLTVEHLDVLYQHLHAHQKELSDDSLLEQISDAGKMVDLQIELIKDIVATKQADIATKLDRVQTLQKNQHIKDIIAKKKDAALEDLSVEELEAMINPVIPI